MEGGGRRTFFSRRLGLRACSHAGTRKLAAHVAHTDPTQEPLLNLAPKKVNWDLKRDIEPQMKKLRAATDRAIIDPLSGIRRQKPQPRPGSL